MSALKCPKCNENEELSLQLLPTAQTIPKFGNSDVKKNIGCIVPNNPLDFNSMWSCTVHHQIKVKNSLIIVVTLKLFFIEG